MRVGGGLRRFESEPKHAKQQAVFGELDKGVDRFRFEVRCAKGCGKGAAERLGGDKPLAVGPAHAKGQGGIVVVGGIARVFGGVGIVGQIHVEFAESGKQVSGAAVGQPKEQKGCFVAVCSDGYVGEGKGDVGLANGVVGALGFDDFGEGLAGFGHAFLGALAASRGSARSVGIRGKKGDFEVGHALCVRDCWGGLGGYGCDAVANVANGGQDAFRERLAVVERDVAIGHGGGGELGALRTDRLAFVAWAENDFCGKGSALCGGCHGVLERALSVAAECLILWQGGF